MADTPSFKHRHTVKNTKHTDISIDPQQLAAMASNKSIASPGLLLFLAMALVLTATSVRAQSPSPTPAPPAPTTLPPAAAPSQNPCPSGFNNTVAFAQGVRAYLLRGISLIFSPVKVTPGTSTYQHHHPRCLLPTHALWCPTPMAPSHACQAPKYDEHA
jgi:hypothetical protein